MHGPDLVEIVGHWLEGVPELRGLLPLLLLAGRVGHVCPVLRLVQRGQDGREGVEGVLAGAAPGVAVRVSSPNDGAEALFQFGDQILGEEAIEYDL